MWLRLDPLPSSTYLNVTSILNQPLFPPMRYVICGRPPTPVNFHDFHALNIKVEKFEPESAGILLNK